MPFLKIFSEGETCTFFHSFFVCVCDLVDHTLTSSCEDETALLLHASVYAAMHANGKEGTIKFICRQGLLLHLQVIVKSMGCVILAPLLNEVVKKAKGLDQYQAAITHLTRVGASSSST